MNMSIKREKGDLKGFKVITGSKITYREWSEKRNGLEPYRANPDLIPESDVSPDNTRINAIKEARLQIIPTLTIQQLRVFEEVFDNGKTSREAAKVLNLSQTRVQQLKKIVARKLEEKFNEELEKNF